MAAVGLPLRWLRGWLRGGLRLGKGRAQLAMSFIIIGLVNAAGFEPRIPRVPDSGPVVPCVSFPRLTCELMTGKPIYF